MRLCRSLLIQKIALEAEQAPSDAPEQPPNYLAMLAHPSKPPRRWDLKVGAVSKTDQYETLDSRRRHVHTSLQPLRCPTLAQVCTPLELVF